MHLNSRRLINNASTSVAQTIVSGITLFFLYRYLISALGSEQLGLWSIILASTSAARLSDIGLTGSVVKFVARYIALKDSIQAALIVQTAILSIAFASIILTIIFYPLLITFISISIPAHTLPQALNILPLACISLWLGILGGVIQSGLDGCQRMDIRNALMIIGNLLLLGLTVLLIPRYGLIGLAISQVAQSLFLTIANWVALRSQIRSLPAIPINWSKEKFKEMISYSINFQIGTFAILLFDPATKLLMSRFGGLSNTGYFEMANQMVIKLRAIITTATQALAPTVASLQETSPEKTKGLYLKSNQLLYFLTVPLFILTISSLPLVSLLWIGKYEENFVFFGTVLTIGWGINTLASVAYFFNLGTGDVRLNSIAHVLMATLNIPLGFILGIQFHDVGVAIGSMIALTIASIFIILKTNKQRTISNSSLIPKKYHQITLIMILTAIAIKLIFTYSNTTLDKVFSCTAYLMMNAICISILLWHHPARKDLPIAINSKI